MSKKDKARKSQGKKDAGAKDAGAKDASSDKLRGKDYEKELENLHGELVKLQQWVVHKSLKV